MNLAEAIWMECRILKQIDLELRTRINSWGQYIYMYCSRISVSKSTVILQYFNSEHPTSTRTTVLCACDRKSLTICIEKAHFFYELVLQPYA
jgi:hypothetical protein